MAKFTYQNYIISDRADKYTDSDTGAELARLGSKSQNRLRFLDYEVWKAISSEALIISPSMRMEQQILFAIWQESLNTLSSMPLTFQKN